MFIFAFNELFCMPGLRSRPCMKPYNKNSTLKRKEITVHQQAGPEFDGKYTD